MIPQNWNSFGPVEGEEDLVVDIEPNVTEAPEKRQETIWYGSQPAPVFVLNLGD